MMIEHGQHVVVMAVVAVCALGVVRMLVREMRGRGCAGCAKAVGQVERVVGLTVRGKAACR